MKKLSKVFENAGVLDPSQYTLKDGVLTIPDSVQEIEKYAFVGNNLTEVKLSENTTYNKSTFDDNVKIKNI